MRENIALLSDSYKYSHYLQYPPNTTNVFSYFESRLGGKFNYTVFFGLQAILKRYLAGVVVTKEDVDEAEALVNEHMSSKLFNRAAWDKIVNKHGGRLPIRIRAVPEGTVVPSGNVLMTIENTDPDMYWLTNYLETLLVQVWYPTTVATLSHAVSQSIAHYLEKTGTPELLPFKLHDFGFRGVSSVESAGLGSSAHLVNFQGTDTVHGITYARRYYGAKMPGYSIPASEHSTITSWGKYHEVDAFKNMLEKYPTGLMACVSDSYDIDKACSELWGKDLKDNVLSRDGVLVVRPDSGDIVEMVLNVLGRLGSAFGTSLNSKGYRVLTDKVRVIQGDGCSKDTIGEVLGAMTRDGWSADNIAFGMGGGLLQKVDRDTLRFAFKCSSVVVGGEERDVYKEPKSDKSKNSKRGRLDLAYAKRKSETDPKFKTVRELGGGRNSALLTVFENGELYNQSTFDDIRERVKS